MGFSVADRVKERTTTTGVGSVTLNGDYVDGFQPFSSGIASGETTFYVIDEPVVNNADTWEVGVGTFISGTLTRDIILSSSSNGEKINLNGSGVISITYPAERSVYLNDSLNTVAGSGVLFTNDSSKILNTQNGHLYWNNIKLTDNNETVYVSGIATYASGTVVSLGNATSSNTPNTLVKRDGSGGFCAGLIESTKIDVDNITIDGNTICSTDTNGYINITPNGNGGIVGGVGNSACGQWSIVAGGGYNEIGNSLSSILGGYYNCTTPPYATIGGGYSNSIQGLGFGKSILGGSYNTIYPAFAGYSTIVGGFCNSVNSGYTFIGGGIGNKINDKYSNYSIISGGSFNVINSGNLATIAGGANNTASCNASFIGGGSLNKACGNCSSVLGGEYNIAAGQYSSAVGYCNNAVCTNSHVIGSGLTANAPNTTFVNNLNINDYILAPNIGTGTNNSVVILDDDGRFKTDEIDERVWGTTLVDETDLTYVSGIAVYASGAFESLGFEDYQNIDSDTILNSTNVLIFVDSTDSEINVYMPLASGIGGKQIKVKWIDGTNPITIIASGVETIDGQNSFSMYQKYQSITFSSNNTNWFIT